MRHARRVRSLPRLMAALLVVMMLAVVAIDQVVDRHTAWAQQFVLDHFQCYEIKPGAFVSTSVSVQDQFGSLIEQVRFPHRLCNPTDKNGGGIIDPTDHLVAYEAKSLGGFTKRSNQTVVDQFGTHLLDVTRPAMLMVPTSKDGVQQLPPLDHFQCYKVKRSKGAPKFAKLTVAIVNQFETVTEIVVKARYLCAPASKNNEDPTAPSHPDHLLCYKTRDGNFGESDHSISNQFGLDQVRTIHRKELCLPALKNPVTVTSSSTTTTVTTSSTTTTTLYGSPSRAFLDSIRSLLD